MIDLNFKNIKEKARKVFKNHYVILALACALAALAGSEFAGSLSINETTDMFNQIKYVMPGVHDKVENIKNTAASAGEKIAESGVFTKQRGVFSLILNSVGSNKIYFSFFSLINSIIKQDSITNIILTILIYAFYSMIWFYIVNVFGTIIRRVFLEARTYEKVKVERFLFLYYVKKWTMAAFTLLRTSIQQFLWGLTIIGGVIKYYSYQLVPFIVAENPSIPSGEAIKLSRNMMAGYKFKKFLLDMSFIGWEVLGILTFNLSKIFFSNPFKLATDTEFFVLLRNEWVASKKEGYEYFIDTYLYKKASKNELESTYLDITNKMKEQAPKLEERTGFKGYLDNNFGITMYSKKDNEMLEKEQIRQASINSYLDIMQRKSYPEALYPIAGKKKKNRLETLNYLRHYTIPSLVLLFFILSFGGWLWEVILHIISDGSFVNRGVLHGPWLPIYGAGCVLILTLLYRFRTNPWVLFLLTMVLCGIVEYYTSVYLEFTHNGTKWWDYTGYFLNINGRVCAEGLLVFGLGGVAMTYFLAPVLDNYIRKIDFKVLVIICVVLISLYIIDSGYSRKYPNVGHGITDYEAYMENSWEVRL